NTLHHDHPYHRKYVLFNPHQYILSVYNLCETIVLNNGTRWKTVCEASNHELQDRQMVLVCPSCHVAYVVME
ncbi:MAG: hypothetical protein ACW98U_04570, partial [Candidatus Thorarchaeota archaeon]